MANDFEKRPLHHDETKNPWKQASGELYPSFSMDFSDAGRKRWLHVPCEVFFIRFLDPCQGHGIVNSGPVSMKGPPATGRTRADWENFPCHGSLPKRRKTLLGGGGRPDRVVTAARKSVRFSSLTDLSDLFAGVISSRSSLPGMRTAGISRSGREARPRAPDSGGQRPGIPPRTRQKPDWIVLSWLEFLRPVRVSGRSF